MSSSLLKIPSEQEFTRLLVKVFAEPFQELLNNPQVVSAIKAALPADGDAADYRAIAQKLVAKGISNWIGGLAKEVLTSNQNISACDRSFIEENLVSFPIIFNSLEIAIEKLESEVRASAYENIRELILASSVLGMTMMFSEQARANFQKIRAAGAQARNIEKASIRKEKLLRPAIREATKGLELNGSMKFAESIQETVCRIADVKLTERGYSPRTIQRVIETILEERRND
jgi:hypothetical protein